MSVPPSLPARFICLSSSICLHLLFSPTLPHLLITQRERERVCVCRCVSLLTYGSRFRWLAKDTEKKCTSLTPPPPPRLPHSSLSLSLSLSVSPRQGDLFLVLFLIPSIIMIVMMIIIIVIITRARPPVATSPHAS